MKELERIGEFRVHPVASIFPMMSEKEWQELCVSVSDIGLQEPVVVHEGLLVDGRNRAKACLSIGHPIRTVEWKQVVAHHRLRTGQGGMDDFPATCVDEWIMAKNIRRRHLTEDQRIALWSEYHLWQEEEDARQRMARKPKNSADTKSYPQNQERDFAEKNANSTVGRIASATKSSHHKAAQAVKLVKAVESGAAPKEDLELVKAGLKKLSDAVKPLRPQKPEPASETLEDRVKTDLLKLIGRYPTEQHARVKQIIKEAL